MTLDDSFGYKVTTSRPDALRHWEKTVRAFISHAADTPVHLQATLDADPNFAFAHIAKGFFLLLLGRRELLEAAEAAYREASRIVAEESTPRERDFVEALRLYFEGDLTASAARVDQVLAEHPRDALALKMVQAIRFVLGDARGMRSSIEAVLPVYADHSYAPYVNGCYAFALEETGDYRAAEIRGRDAVLRANDDAWGVHAVAHVFDMTNRVQEGVTWLASQPQTWEHCNNFRYHVWWHLALFHLDRGDYAEALRLYDEEVRNERTDDYRDISNGASLLSRLEIEGVDVGDRWQEMSDLCENRVDDGCVVFADLHYMLALTANDKQEAAGRMLGRMRRDAAKSAGDMAKVNAQSGAVAGNGLMAFASGSYSEAYACLATARPHLHKVGGSHAQRDVFTRILIESALRAGLLDEARAEIDARAKRRGALDGYSERRLTQIAAYKSLDAASL